MVFVRECMAIVPRESCFSSLSLVGCCCCFHLSRPIIYTHRSNVFHIHARTCCCLSSFEAVKCWCREIIDFYIIRMSMINIICSDMSVIIVRENVIRYQLYWYILIAAIETITWILIKVQGTIIKFSHITVNSAHITFDDSRNFKWKNECRRPKKTTTTTKYRKVDKILVD